MISGSHQAVSEFYPAKVTEVDLVSETQTITTKLGASIYAGAGGKGRSASEMRALSPLAFLGASAHFSYPLCVLIDVQSMSSCMSVRSPSNLAV